MRGGGGGGTCATATTARHFLSAFPILKPCCSFLSLNPLRCRHYLVSSLSPPSLFHSTKPFALAMAKPIDEADVGITCYISPLPGFRGVLKQRYSDFIVREVDTDGNVVRLTSLDPPIEDVEDSDEKVPDSTIRGHAEEIQLFRSLAGDADAELLEQFLGKIASGDEKNTLPISLSPDADKAHRAEVHSFFKKNFKFLITDTVEESGNVKRIRVRFSSVESGGGRDRGNRKRKERSGKCLNEGRPFDSRGSDNWPEHLGKFIRFHLYKENKDTQEALGVIGKMLGIQPRSFGFAGTKDKRAVTTQRVTVFKQHAKKLSALNNRLIGIRVGDFCYVREGLVLGQLFGNHFTITLRGVVAETEATIKTAADHLGKNGFINYYGLQRFGSGSVPTHHVGAALLRGQWKAAVGLILDPRLGERDLVRESREYYKDTGDIDGTLRRLPRYLVAERAILQCLKKCPGNYLQALKAIPRTLRMMYVHSYQSYLWNHAASMRVQKYGVEEVVMGDLVFCKGSSAVKLDRADSVELQDDFFEDTNDSHVDESFEIAFSEEKTHPVKALNAQDLLDGCYNFDDVVLPLPGSRIIYPDNSIADVYHELAERDGINLAESVHGAKEFSITSMTGGYRQVFQRPNEFSWELLRYSDINVPLAETDLDFISKTRISSPSKGEDMTNGGCNKQVHEKSDNINTICSSDTQRDIGNKCCFDTPSQQLALKLSFILPSSSYATMAVRELLKNSTSVAFQKTLNN